MVKFWRQDTFELCLQQDLPEKWFLPLSFRARSERHPSELLEEAIQYRDSYESLESKKERVEREKKDIARTQWVYLENGTDNIRVWLRLSRNWESMFPEVRVTGVTILPWYESPVLQDSMKLIPIAEIERNITQRLFRLEYNKLIFGKEVITLYSGAKFPVKHFSHPLGKPKEDPDFYQKVAMQYGYFVQKGRLDPTEAIAENNKVSSSTARGWVSRARHLQLLPPGKITR